MKQNQIIRIKAEKELLEIIQRSKKSEFLYLRGRRRVGKSTLLKKIQTSHPNIFYFIGIGDESGDKTLARFAKAWDQFTGKKSLLRLKKIELDWNTIFDEITTFTTNNKSISSLTLMLDEIQWIAKGRSGFIGTLKEKWLEWEQTNKIKVVLCGSSNKFFIEQTGGEEKILRGLKTHSDILLPPLHPIEVKENYFSSWSSNEAIMAYMLLGGIPYYLNQLETNQNFIKTINEAVFTKKTIFLTEVDEILNLEFNRAGIKKAKQIFSAIGPLGATQAQIKEKINISESTLSEAVSKLFDYSLLKEKKVYKPKNLKSQVTYFYDDPYLLFYFSVLQKYSDDISENDSRLIFADILASSKSFYIPNFTGRAFEIFIRNLFLCDTNETQKAFLNLLHLPDKKYQLFDSYNGDSNVDLFIEHKGLRSFYAIECKWTNSSDVISDGLDQLEAFNENNKELKAELVLISNFKFTGSLLKKAQKQNIKIIEINKIFE